MPKQIESDFVYEENGIVKFLPLGNSTGFYFGSTTSRKFRGIQTTDIAVAEAIRNCGESMIRHLKALKKQKASKKKKVIKKKGVKNA